MTGKLGFSYGADWRRRPSAIRRLQRLRWNRLSEQVQKRQQSSQIVEATLVGPNRVQEGFHHRQRNDHRKNLLNPKRSRKPKARLPTLHSSSRSQLPRLHPRHPRRMLRKQAKGHCLQVALFPHKGVHLQWLVTHLSFSIQPRLLRSTARLLQLA